MHKKLSFPNVMGLGFMVFAIFLGAGNLIFPPLAGLQAGDNCWYATLGFLLSGVGLPFMGIIIVSKFVGGFNKIAQEMPKWFLMLIGTLVFLILCPFYATPRTALVTYEVSILPFISEPSLIHKIIFCFSFFFISGWMCLNPGYLLEAIGKIITPLLIILLFILGLMPVFFPHSAPSAAVGKYATAPFWEGFLNGYLTMDGIGSLIFGLVIITNLKSHGITDKKDIAKYSIISGIIASIGLAFVYISLFYLGATSQGVILNPTNGGQVLSGYVSHVFGLKGDILLALIIFFACLTTAVGLTTAVAEYFEESFSIKYKPIIFILSLLSFIISLLSLDEIIRFFIPILNLLYPLFIMLILLGFIKKYIPNSLITYRVSIGITFMFSFMDVIHQHFNLPMLTWINNIPGSSNSLTWCLPAAIAVLLSLFYKKSII